MGFHRVAKDVRTASGLRVECDFFRVGWVTPFLVGSGNNLRANHIECNLFNFITNGYCMHCFVLIVLLCCLIMYYFRMKILALLRRNDMVAFMIL